MIGWILALPLQADPPATQPARAEARALRIEVAEAPKIDGILDDALWKRAPTIGEFTQREPRLGAAPTERTEIRIAHDGQVLYVGIYCHDSEPAQIRQSQVRRDAFLDTDDRVEIVFDTLHDHRNAFFFQIGPAGSIGDGLVSGNGANFNKSWDGIWTGRSAVVADGWCAELAIPFRTVVTSSDGSSWGMNFARYIVRKNEEDVWSSPSRDRAIFRVSEAGNLYGMERLEHGIGLDVVPYGRGAFSNHHDPDDTDAFLTGGGEIFYRWTPGLTAALTANTDFAETEADERRVNLTRFPLFFPEKRKFFLEDASVFQFDTGSRGGDLLPFFSRRIGLGPGGQTIPIFAGGKVSGYEGPWSLGVLGVATGRKDELGPRELAVARVRYNIDEYNTIGGIVTSGNPVSPDDSQTVGFDYRYSVADFGGDKSLDVRMFVLKTETEGVDGNDRAMGAEVNYPNDIWRWRLRAREIGDDFHPALGFVTRTGIRTYDGELGFRPRVGRWIRRFAFTLSPLVNTDLAGTTQDAVLAATAQIEWESGDVARAYVRPAYEHVSNAFDIVPNTTIPAGSYTVVRHGVALESSLKRAYSSTVRAEFGRRYDGEETDVAENFTYHPSGFFHVGVDGEQNYLRFPSGRKDVQVGRLRTEVNVSPFVSWENFAQFDNVSKGAGINSRLRWIVGPGKDIYFVFNQNWTETPSRAVVPADTGVVLKVAFTLRF